MFRNISLKLKLNNKVNGINFTKFKNNDLEISQLCLSLEERNSKTSWQLIQNLQII